MFLHSITLVFLAVGGSTSDYAAWSKAKANSQGTWTTITESAVRGSKLPDLVPADAKDFCPPYNELDKEARIKFWVGLISKISELESDFNPHDRYTENFKDKDGNFVVSRGLLQLSLGDKRDPEHDCKFSSVEELETPATNLKCGVSILSALVNEDGFITTSGKVEKGGARYWSVLRRTGKLEEIDSFTRPLAVCKVAR